MPAGPCKVHQTPWPSGNRTSVLSSKEMPTHRCLRLICNKELSPEHVGPKQRGAEVEDRAQHQHQGGRLAEYLYETVQSLVHYLRTNPRSIPHTHFFHSFYFLRNLPNLYTKPNSLHVG